MSWLSFEAQIETRSSIVLVNLIITHVSCISISPDQEINIFVLGGKRLAPSQVKIAKFISGKRHIPVLMALHIAAYYFMNSNNLEKIKFTLIRETHLIHYN